MTDHPEENPSIVVCKFPALPVHEPAQDEELLTAFDGHLSHMFMPSDVLLHVCAETDLTLAQVAHHLGEPVEVLRSWIQDDTLIPDRIKQLVVSVGKRLYDPALMNTSPSVRTRIFIAMVDDWKQGAGHSEELSSENATVTPLRPDARIKQLETECDRLNELIKTLHATYQKELEAEANHWQEIVDNVDAALTAGHNRAVKWGRERETERDTLSKVVERVRLWALGLDAGDVLTDEDFELLTQSGLFSTTIFHRTEERNPDDKAT